MIPLRALFLADGPSDEPLGRHVAALALLEGVALDVVTPEFARMDPPPGHTVSARLGRMLEIDDRFDVLVVHRDAEGQAASDRVTEVEMALDSENLDWPRVPIIPVRMTEAWLLLEEADIRFVAGRPSGINPLNLPPISGVESVPDPKLVLRQVLKHASGLSGRRLRKFERDFPAHRRQLLDRLDREGPVKRLEAWSALELATLCAMRQALAARDQAS